MSVRHRLAGWLIVGNDSDLDLAINALESASRLSSE